jgi:gliding motility-associated-like protein
MYNKALRLLIFFCFHLFFFTALGQLPAARYSIKYNSPETKRISVAKIAITDIPAAGAPPNISYQTPQTYLLNSTITTLNPANTGGTVPATIYAEVSNYSFNSFSTATGVTVDATGNVYVADWGLNQIRKITPAGAGSLFAGNPGGSMGTSDGQGAAAAFYTPDALAIDQVGNIYVADQANHMIRKITAGGLVSTFAGSGIPGNIDGTGAAASFNNPRGLTVDNAGNVYVADQNNNLIRKITPAGVVTTFAGTGSGGLLNGPRLSATFNTPTAVDIDAAGNLYISDGSNNVIRKINTAGDVSTLATGFNFPRELRIDGTGNIYVADQNSYTIKRISPAGIVTTIAGNGNSGNSNGVGTAATFSSPIGLWLDGKGNMFVGDGNYIRKIVISGYTIDKALPPGLTFDPKTGIITGTPTALWPATNYTITAYNGGGSSSTNVNIQVLAILPSIITLPLQQPILDANNNYNPGATSTNNETPITYTSSNPAVAYPTANGLIHVIAPGVTVITASQAGNANYGTATPVSQTLTVVEYLSVYLPPFTAKTLCDADFSANAAASNTIIPLTYTSSNPAVATISTQGTIHIVGIGTTTITVSQNASPPLYVSATPQSQTLTVTLPVSPSVTIAAIYDSPCVGSTVTFTASTQNGGTNPTYQWQVNNINTGSNSAQFTSLNLKNSDVVNCIVTNTTSTCIAGYPTKSDILTVNLITPQAPTVSITASANSVFAGTLISFTATTKNAFGNVNYQWYVNGIAMGGNNATFANDTFINGDVVACTITPVAACSTPASSNVVTINIVEKITIPNTFTPNGDGINDLWNIVGIASYPNCVVDIFNRYGTLIYQSKGYPTSWNGTVNGKPVPTSTYYYIIDLGLKNQKLSGQLTIIN